MMPNAPLLPVLVILLLLLSSSSRRAAIAARGEPVLYSAPSTASPPVALDLHDRSQGGFVAMDPASHGKRHGIFGGREVKSCMPKGFRRTSAPSRFVNYEPLGSSARCSPVPRDSPSSPNR